MDIHNIIHRLSPINKKEKVDTLIQKMRENGVALTKTIDTAIRCAIQKMSIQMYYAEHYGGNIVREERKEEETRPQEPKVTSRKERAILERKQKEKTKKKQKPIEEEPTPKPRSAPSVLRTFGTNYKDANKRVKDATKEDQERHRGLIRPTSTTSSVSHISIPAGGMNKRY